jgi:hypothetical protein
MELDIHTQQHISMPAIIKLEEHLRVYPLDSLWPLLRVSCSIRQGTGVSCPLLSA